MYYAKSLKTITTRDLFYLDAQWVDNARIAENHERQRQDVSDKNYEYRQHLFYVMTFVDPPRCTDSIDDVGCETCHCYHKSWESKPDRKHRGHVCHALLRILLQPYTQTGWLYYTKKAIKYTLYFHDSFLADHTARSMIGYWHHMQRKNVFTFFYF